MLILRSLSPHQAEAARKHRRATLVAVQLVAVVIGNAIGSVGPVPEMDAALHSLLVMMAMLKFATAVGAFALAYWRLAAPIERSYARVYLLGAGLMTIGANAMWHPAHLVVAGLLFHAGLIAFLLTAYVDRDGAAEPLRAVLAKRRS